jgi:hypothetical protein
MGHHLVIFSYLQPNLFPDILTSQEQKGNPDSQVKVHNF